jgi:hypothetical protein
LAAFILALAESGTPDAVVKIVGVTALLASSPQPPPL